MTGSDPTSLDFRETPNPNSFRIYEGEEWIGNINYHAPYEEGVDGDWSVEMWSLMGTGKKWGAEASSREDAVEAAQAIYEEGFVPERREARRPVPGVRVISTPTGGQRRRSR